MTELTTTGSTTLPPQYLSNVIHQMLMERDMELACAWRSLYAEPMDQSIENQLATINRFWRDQLSRLPVNTINERECLIDNIHVDDWTRLFYTHVLHTVVQYRLPVQRWIPTDPSTGLPAFFDILNWSNGHAG